MPSRLHCLVEADEIRIAESDDGTIIASSPWVRGEGEVPHRVVLRLMNGSYAVHCQAISGDVPYYYWGSYLPTSNEKDFIGEAWAIFDSRSRSHLDIK